MQKPTSYRGVEPYIFISYAHLDSELVWPIITRLQEDGFRVWYDEGIRPVEDWPQTLADRIDRCGCFLAFITENYLVSDNCIDEIMYARDKNKDRCLIYLSPVTLPGGLQLRLGRLQVIHWFAFSDVTQAFEKLYETDGILTFCAPSDEAQAPAQARYDESEDLFQQGLVYLREGKHTTGFNHLLAAAQRGHTQAMVQAGNCCRKGLGTAQDEAAAAQWYQKSAKQGAPEGQYEYGCCFLSGSGIALDEAQAVQWLTRAAEQEHAQAQCILANCYSLGHGVPQDHADAVYWYKRSAALGCAEAQYHMGHAKEYGMGALRDGKAAVDYYKQAAGQGHIDAQCALGRLYYEGSRFKGVRQDTKRAIHWYSLAAEQGDSWAQYNLAKCYLWGGKPYTDRPRAKQLLLRAAANGDRITRFFAQCSLVLFFFTLAPSKTRP